MNAASTAEDALRHKPGEPEPKRERNPGTPRASGGGNDDGRAVSRKIEPHHANKPAFAKWPPRILVAEDDGEMRRMLVQLLRLDGYEVVECPDGVGLLDQLSTFLGRTTLKDFDLIISDIRMPGLTGLEVIGGLHRMKGFPPTILMTAFGDPQTHAHAQRIGVVAMFDKPFDTRELMAKVRETAPIPEGAIRWSATQKGYPRPSTLFHLPGEGA